MKDSAPLLQTEDLALLNEFLEENFGIIFPDHKHEVLESRLRPRLATLGLSSFREYYLRLAFNSNGRAELLHLARHVTNNETYFFRETNQFENLFEHAIVCMKEESVLPGTLRFLCAGCSSGEEAYTLNIFAKENRYRMWEHAVQIEAFDLDDSRIAMAKAAQYGPASLRGMAPELIERYFSAGSPPGTFALKPPFRSGVSFSTGNILRPETYRSLIPYDAVFCRNVFIYFSEASLRKALEHFAGTLRPGGMLFLGHSESIIGFTPCFESVRIGDTIAYRKAP